MRVVCDDDVSETSPTHFADMVYAPDHPGAMENQGIIIADDQRLLQMPWPMVLHETAHHVSASTVVDLSISDAPRECEYGSRRIHSSPSDFRESTDA